jgi:hypothetical protein
MLDVDGESGAGIQAANRICQGFTRLRTESVDAGAQAGLMPRYLPRGGGGGAG